MNLITKYLTPEGRAFRYKQDITKNLEAKLFSKAVESFCLLFKHFAQRKEWADLSDICPKYLADLVEHKASLASKLTNVEIEQAIAALRANQLLSPAIFLGDYFDSHNQVIDLYAQTLDPHKLFFYIESKKLLNLKTITDAIQQWEQHNSAVSAGSDFALHLKRIASENPNWIPQKAHIKESIENYDAAAELYKSNNDRSKAAFCYEKAGKYQEAIDLYKSLGHKETVSILAEKIGDYETAIQYVVKPERKFDLLLKTEKLNEALAFAHGFPNVYDYVSLVKEKAKSLTKKKEAEHEYISALEYNNLVGDEVLKNTLLEKARAYYLQQQLASNNSNRLKELIMKRINLEESTANYALAGKIAEEELKDTLLAIHYYEKANLFHKAIKLTSENLSTSNNIELIEKLAELHNQGGNLLKAASLYVSIKQYENAYNLYQSLGNYEKAIECYLKLQYQDENILLDLYHSVGNYSKLIEIYMNKNTYTSLKTALEIAENSHDLMKASLIKRKLAAFKTYSQDELEQKYNEALTKTIQQYSSIIGIDFGTTTSVCAIYNKESRKVEIITNPKGGTYIDSYFAITAEGGYIFGDKAKLLSLTHPDLVVPRVKRYLGENKKFIVNNKIYTTEEIIAHQLSNLRELTNEYIRNKVKETLYNSLITIQSDNFKDVIEDFLQKKVLNVVKDAVLTVPAYFNDSQKRATRDAADIAGLNIRRLLHEPTAAAVAFEHQRKYKGKIAIIDLGGGTFDISIVDIDEGVFNVDKIGGNTKLGGSDIDELLFLFFQKKIKDELWVDLTDQKYKVEASRLKDACENLKINLSNYETYRIELPFFLNMPEYILELSRKELEHISDNFFKDFQKTIKETLDTFN
jgi:molecular chaperone DnaK